MCKLVQMFSLLKTGPECVIAPAKLEQTAPHLPNGTSSDHALSATPCCCLCASTENVNALTGKQQFVLWHMCLGHINEKLVSDLHKCIDGAPALPCSNVLHSCPMCDQAKLHKANHGDTNTTEATNCWQVVQVDFGFFCPMFFWMVG